jgi:hypothetical protein
VWSAQKPPVATRRGLHWSDVKSICVMRGGPAVPVRRSVPKTHSVSRCSGHRIRGHVRLQCAVALSPTSLDSPLAFRHHRVCVMTFGMSRTLQKMLQQLLYRIQPWRALASSQSPLTALPPQSPCFSYALAGSSCVLHAPRLIFARHQAAFIYPGPDARRLLGRHGQAC